jgi:hypothetical protein
MAAQSFTLFIQNAAGVIQHKIASDAGGAALGAFSRKINGASATYTSTQLVGAMIDFDAGVGIDAAATQILYLDTDDQGLAADFDLSATIEYNSTGNNFTVVARPLSTNVSGVTRLRPALVFYTSPAGAGFLLNTTNIPAGKAIILRVRGFIR